MFTKLSNIEHLSEENQDLPDITINEEPLHQNNEIHNKNIQVSRIDPYALFSQRHTENAQSYEIFMKERQLEQQLQRLEQMQRNTSESMFEQYFNRKIEKMKNKETMQPKTEYSCVEISKHIESCPVCSKLYNERKTETVYVKEDNCEDCKKWKNICIILTSVCIILFLIILKIYLFK